MNRKAIAAVLVIALLAVGCSSDGDASTEPDKSGNGRTGAALTDADGNVLSDGVDGSGGDSVEGGPTAEAARNSESGFNERVLADSKIRDRQAIPIQRVESDGKTLTVYFEMGSQKCFGVDTEIDETDSQVKISLWTGLIADVNSNSCGVGVYPYQTTVNLAAPIGDRNIIAGDDGGPQAAITPSKDGKAETLEIEVDAAGDPDPSQFVGLDIEVAIDLAEGNALKWRVNKIDGETRDDGSSKADRLSFEIQDNIVATAAWS